MKTYDPFNVPAITTVFPKLAEIRLVPWQVAEGLSADLPNLEVEFKDKKDEIVKLYFNIKKLGDDNYGVDAVRYPVQFEPKVTEFIERVGKEFGLTLYKRAHNSEIKGLRSRIRAVCNRLYSPMLGQTHIVDSALAPRIMRAEMETTTFRAWRYQDTPPDMLKGSPVFGISGFFKLGDELGYWIIDGYLTPLVVHNHGAGVDMPLIRDSHRLMEKYRMHIIQHFPFVMKLGMEMEMADTHAKTRFALNAQTGAYFFAQAAKAGELHAVEVDEPEARHASISAPKTRWRNATILEIAKRFCASPADFQLFLTKITEHHIPFTSRFEVDIHGDGKIRLYSTSQCTMPFIIVEQEGETA